MSDAADREAWVARLAQSFLAQIEAYQKPHAATMCAQIAAAWAEKLADDHAENWGVARDLPLPWVPESWAPPTGEVG